MTWGSHVEAVALSLVVGACGPRAGKPDASASPSTARPMRSAAAASVPPSAPPIEVGQPCPPAEPPTIVDGDKRPVDMTNEASLMKVVGKPILVCAPVRRALSGRVVDSDTGAPIPDAAVTIESWQTPPPIGGLQKDRRLLHAVATRTDAQGNWNVPAQSDWMPGILAADGLPFFIDSWCVTAQGYAARVHDPWAPSATTSRGVMEIALTRGSASTISIDKTRSACGLLLSPGP
jgi:hypothetical protein